MQQIYCNQCGTRFEPTDQAQRCCGNKCSSRLIASWGHYRQPMLTKLRTKALLILRERPGEPLTIDHLAVGLYGDADYHTRKSVSELMSRLTNWTSPFGMRIERDSIPRVPEGPLVTYRLAADAEVPLHEDRRQGAAT